MLLIGDRDTLIRGEADQSPDTLLIGDRDALILCIDASEGGMSVRVVGEICGQCVEVIAT